MYAKNKPSGPGLLWIVLMVLILTGCRTTRPEPGVAAPEEPVQRIQTLRHMSLEQAGAALDLLGLAHGDCTPKSDSCILLTGTLDQVKIAEVVLDVMDSGQEYCVEALGPVSIARTLSSAGRLREALGELTIGTLQEPPAAGVHPRAIIDIRGGSVLAIIPVRCRDRLHAALRNDSRTEVARGDASHNSAAPAADGSHAAQDVIAAIPAARRQAADVSALGGQAPPPQTVVTLAQMSEASGPGPQDKSGRQSLTETGSDVQADKTIKISFAPPPHDAETAERKTTTDKAVPANGEDLLAMTLPETITLIQLLDLVGKHVGLNYVYDPREISNQPISLKLFGELRGEMKIKDLYALLETVLDFMNLAMIRQERNFVAVVPMDKALQTQPELVGGSDAVQVGDTVVTRVFDIRHVDISSVMALLQNMKLSVAATALDNTNLLLVTCHAGRMPRIEQLVEMIDCPGRSAECRLRRLSYVRATPLIAKIRSLAGELKDMTVAAPAAASKPASPAGAPAAKPAAAIKAAEPMGQGTVYLDADERTNRIVMIGMAEELTRMEELIDALDVAQEDPRSPHIYTLRHLNAEQAVDKLQKLEVLKGTSRSGAAPEAGVADALVGEPLVAVLESTNQLVVQAAPDQHERIREFLDYIDVAAADTRTIAAYQLQHIDVHVAKETLEELDLVNADSKTSSFASEPNQPRGFQGTAAVPVALSAGNSRQKAPLVVSESTNSLLVMATSEQHARIAKIIQYIDRYTPEEEWVYQVYPLESSSPNHLADLLERLIQETVTDKDGKIERVTPKTQERISIVPDPNTFSLIVYANQKSQKWIDTLITRLDKRRPQVLIDVTLVEITRADTFEYDLSLVAADNSVIGNLVVDPIQTTDSSSRLEGGFNLLDDDGNPTGTTRAFYNDRHIQALLTAMQRKNYGRVLAKPKVLVDDGREGEIITTDTTTYVKESIQIPQTGNPITTREFVPIDASIDLKITPHISEGNLLRLDVFMSRDDFGTRPLSGAPPDKATSEVTTTVFVPDDRTVILGGLVKLNQSKGGSKVPILGDVPLIGVLFRSIDNSDVEKKLYVFLKANIVRPYDGSGLTDLQEISEKYRDAFEESETQFQEHEAIPGITPEPMPPEGVLRDYE